MTDARGSDVKVYIYLLRCLQDPSTAVSIESIAEALDETEKDIRTALRYWHKQHVLSVHCSRDGKIKNIALFDLEEDDDNEMESFDDDSNITIVSDISKKKEEYIKKEQEYIKKEQGFQKKDEEFEEIDRPNYSVKTIQSFKSDYPEFDDLIDYIERALGKTLSQRDLQIPSFLFEGLGFPADLIRYLYDYCIDRNKRSNSYIEKVAREWHSKGITTVKDAMMEADEFNNRYSAVKNSFGIHRMFGDAELVYIKRWYHEYRFSDDMIKMACDRTLINIGKPGFEYADSILSDWYKHGISTPEEAQSASADYKASNKNYSQRRTGKNSSLQYSQRSYSQAEISAIEKKKLGIL